MLSYTLVLLLVVSSLHMAEAIDDTHYVVPDGSGESLEGNSTYELNYCLRNKNKCFASNSQLKFKPGEYYLNDDFTLTNVYNITIIGQNASIICHPYVGITFINITNMAVDCMRFINCTADRSDYFALNCSHPNETIPIELFADKPKEYGKQASVLFYNCSLEVRNVTIICTAGVHALMMVNMMASVSLNNVTVKMKIENSSNTSIISSGIFFHFYMNSTTDNTSVSLRNFMFNNGCDNSKYFKLSFIVVKFLIVQSNVSINISIVNMDFAKLHNSVGMLYYAKLETFISHNLILDGIQAYNNKADMQLPLFYIVFHGYGFDFKSIRDCKYKSKVIIQNSIFKSNRNIHIIHVKLQKTLLTTTNIIICNCSVLNNANTSFIRTNSEINSLLQLTHTIKLKNINITNNTNKLLGVSLLSFAHGHVKLAGKFIIQGNWYFENIITLYFAALRYHGSINISKNTAYMLMNTLENSYFVFEENVKVKITNNTFHSGIRKTDWLDGFGFIKFYDNERVCIAQFFSSRGNLDDEFLQDKSKINYSLSFSDNIITQPQYLARYDIGLNASCKWLTNMAFKDIPPTEVLQAFIKYSTIRSTRENVYSIPSKICFCMLNGTNNYNCTKREVGPIFPGQLLKLPLVIPSLNLSIFNKRRYYIMLIATAVSTPNGCIIENATEILQTHKNHGCNEYKYTIKYNSFSECELYLRTQQRDTEIVYVKLKPCPAGFILENSMCICDPLLKSEPLLMESCNLENETILRPENSWIKAETNSDHSHVYHVSVRCPFHNCLSHPSHLSLSNPDSQCQYNRAGVLCAQCKKGLSAVFGSFYCKHCTNYYLLIVIPFVIVTLLLLVLIFMFNLTITNGAINIFIFYIDIVSINMSIYFPHCDSVLCMFAPTNHQIETCFYDGMNTYAKMWLFLGYPLYIIFIAALLIVASRYSVIFQRLTAQRALPVLATLFLLSFTGLLRTVSVVLFFFTTVVHIPGESTTLVWVVDTSIALHEPKFILLYIICIIFFLFLLTFNILLLFTKELLQFKTINKIKPLLDVYLGPYKYGFSYWTGLQLLIRIVIFGLTATDRDLNIMLSTILLTLLLWIQAVVQPFKHKFQNFQQSMVLVDIIVINVISLYNRDDNSQASVAVSVLIYGGSYYFIAYIIFHCIVHAFRTTINRGKTRFFAIWKQKIMSKKKMAEIVRLASLRNKIADVTYNYQEFQEPLIEID